MLKEKSDVDDNNVSPALLKRSSILSWEEKQLIDFVRNNPEEKDKLIKILQEGKNERLQ